MLILKVWWGERIGRYIAAIYYEIVLLKIISITMHLYSIRRWRASVSINVLIILLFSRIDH